MLLFMRPDVHGMGSQRQGVLKRWWSAKTSGRGFAVLTLPSCLGE